jgi:hypothetical protein
MTFDEAKDRAVSLVRKTGKMRFVLWVGDDRGGPYTVATEEDLDTFYSGISDEHIVLCTADL